MPRISGVDLPLEKQIRISLRYVYGIGPVNAMEILNEARIDPMKKARELSEDEVGRIVNIIDRSFVVEGALRRQIQQNIAAAQATSAATAATVTAAACPSAASAPGPTPAPARARARPSPARRA